MKVKICGVRRLADAERAIALGATHVGCVLAPDSPRCATVDEARAIARACEGRAPLVLVFRDPEPDSVRRAMGEVGGALAQVHGGRPGLCDDLEREGIACLRVHRVPSAAARLPDLAPTPRQDRPALLDVGVGGTGVSFDWSLLGASAPRFTFVAGGVNPGNVAALCTHRPWGVDVSSGVESRPGIKDPALMQRLFEVMEASCPRS